MKRPYRYIATSPEGFVRHLVTHVIRHGYRFYMAGEMKPSRDPLEFDETLQEKFNYRMSRSERNRRKRAVGPDGESLGLANVHYLRYERSWILIATPGVHPFFDEHSKKNKREECIKTYFRDVHRDPIFFEGYSIRYAEGGYLPRRLWKDPEVPEVDKRRHVRVRIAEDTFRTIRADMIERAASGAWPAESLERAVFNLPYMPYGPVREQLWQLIRWMNKERKERGFKDTLDPKLCIRRWIPAISAFEPVEERTREAA